MLRRLLSKKIDTFILLLIFFTIVLLSLFFYLQKIDNNISKYDIYYKKLENLKIYNREFDNYFLKIFRYLDYDHIVKTTQEFDKDITYLKTSSIQDDFDLDIGIDIDNIEKKYREKILLVERFKTLNARITNSIYVLYDLRENINNKYLDDKMKHHLLNQVFFKIGRILMDMPVKENLFQKELEALKIYKKDDRLFYYFHLHLNHFLHDVKKIKEDLNSHGNSILQIAIEQTIEKLTKSFDENRKEHMQVTITFFILAFFILLILMYIYWRVQKTTRELKAFRFAIENSDNSILITDLHRNIKYVNESFEKTTGYCRDEILGKQPRILKSDLHSEDFYETMNQTLEDGKKWQGEVVNRRKDGSLLYEKTSISPIWVDNQIVQYLSIKLDITKYVEQQKRLEQSSIVYETIGEGIMITDKNKKIISINPAFEKIFGYSFDDIMGETPSVIINKKKNDIFYRDMWDSLNRLDRWTGKMENRTKDGKVLPIWLTIAVVRDKDAEVENYVAIYTNLEEIMEMEEKAEYLAYHDSLTGLPNRAHFERYIEGVFDLAKRDQERVAVLFLDLDRFKVINDTLGHQIGDGMLVEVANRIKKVLDPLDLLARIGGDEFVVVLHPLYKNKEAIVKAEKILAVLRDPIVVSDYHLNTTASIGIALYPEDGEDKNSVIKHADSAMYYAKEKGKDNYQFYAKALSDEVQTRLNLEQALKSALEKEELYLNYQPQYDLQTGKIIGAEALVRWESESLGYVSPDKFIGVAEEMGMIVEIGYFVFAEACREFVRWQKMGLDIEMISINMSSVQFRQENIIEKIKDIINESCISPSNIEVEITESHLMEYSGTNLTILDDFRRMGCHISIDDFGTGYSSMSYLKNLPIDTIKIDKSFVDDLSKDVHSDKVSTAIIALSHSLGYRVIAEGIEDQAQEDFLREHSCDIGQGYLFSRPLDKDTFVTFAKEEQTKSQTR